MKFTSTLFAILAITGLGQAHQFPDFGSGPLHEDIQDFLDLIPTEEMTKIIMDYVSGDPEVQAAINYLLTSTVLKDLMVDVEAIPEVINLINYMQKERVDMYSLINKVNKLLDIGELVPPPSHLHSAILQRTGGIAGLFKDLKQLIPFAEFIRTYVQKMKTSSAFAGFIDQLKSDNFQQVVNKVYRVKSVQIILNGLKSSGVNVQIVGDIMYIVLGITVPNDVSVYQERSLREELADFLELLPWDQCIEVMVKYMNEDQKVQNAVLYMFTSDFHTVLRDIEALKDYQALVVYLEKAGLPVIQGIQELHKMIGMEEYVPPKIENILKSQIGTQKIGDGMKGMIEDIYNLLLIGEIDALYKEKLKNSKVFADFISKLTSSDLQKIIDNLYGNQTYKTFVMACREKGLELQELTKLIARIFGLKFPY